MELLTAQQRARSPYWASIFDAAIERLAELDAMRVTECGEAVTSAHADRYAREAKSARDELLFLARVEAA